MGFWQWVIVVIVAKLLGLLIWNFKRKRTRFRQSEHLDEAERVTELIARHKQLDISIADFTTYRDALLPKDGNSGESSLFRCHHGKKNRKQQQHNRRRPEQTEQGDSGESAKDG